MGYLTGFDWEGSNVEILSSSWAIENISREIQHITFMYEVSEEEVAIFLFFPKREFS